MRRVGFLAAPCVVAACSLLTSLDDVAPTRGEGLDSGPPADGSTPTDAADGSPPVDAADAALPPGTVMWVQVFTTNEPGDIQDDHARVAIAADGSIVVLGHYSGPTQFGTSTLIPSGGGANVFGAKLDPGGKVLWAKGFASTGGILPAAVAVNAGGDAFVGLQTGGTPVTVDSVVAKDNTAGAVGCSMFKLAAADGKAQWAYAFGADAATSLVFLRAIAVQGTIIAVATQFSGKVLITGTSGTGYTAPSMGQDGLVTTHDDTQSGKVPHLNVLGGAGNDVLTSIAADGSGSLYVGGTFASTMLGLSVMNGGTENAFVAKLDSTVTKVWAQNLLGASATSNIGIPFSLAVDGTGNVYMAGGLWGFTNFGQPLPSVMTAGGEDGFLAQLLTSDGTMKYARGIGGTLDDQAQAIATGPAGMIAVAGYYTSPAVTIGSTPLNPPQPGQAAAFLARAAGAGTYAWAKGAVGPNAADFVKAGGVAMDPKDGSVVVAGTFSGTVDFGDGKLRPSSSAGAHQAFYVMKVAP